MRILAFGLAALLATTSLGQSGSRLCKNTSVQVTAPTAQLAAGACAVVAQSQRLFAQCGVPPIPPNLTISIAPEISEDCVGFYHCGDNKIHVLTPDAMTARISEDSVFRFLPASEFYESVLIHELAHAAFQTVPCRVASCRATSEYVAYAMQVMSLDNSARTTIAANSDWQRSISQDEINVMILFMAPDTFARKVWRHLMQQDDACGFIANLADGRGRFDRDMP